MGAMAAWKVLGIGAALALSAGVGQAFAATADGTVLGVIQTATSLGQNGQTALQVQSPVFAGDTINTGPVGEAQILFRDNTKLVVGPNSSMVIDAFVFSGNNSARAVTLNAAKGVFRFFTGSSPKDAYQINTPTATIGVRGTQFDISIEGQGTTRVANFEGVTRICPRDPSRQGACNESKDPCTLSVIRPQDAVVTYGNRDLEFRNRQLKYYFNYVRDQSTLRPDFQVDLKQCRLNDIIILPEPRPVPNEPGPPPPDYPEPDPPPLKPPVLGPGSVPTPTPPGGGSSSTYPVPNDNRPLIRPTP
jgi:hypothetical protein